MDIPGTSFNAGVEAQNSLAFHDSLFPLWDHLLTKANRRVGAYEILGHCEQNTGIPRDFRNSLGTNHTYEVRIDIFRGCLEERIMLAWPTSTTKTDIHSAIEESNLKPSFPNEINKISTNEGQDPTINAEFTTSTPDESIVLIGAIIKRQRINPNEVQQMCKKVGVLPLPLHYRREYFGSSMENKLFIMDRTSRIELQLPDHVKYGEFVAGVICAIKGRILQRKFVLEDMIFPTPKLPIWPQVSKLHNIEMVFISGLQLGKIADDFIHRNLLIEYLQGLAGCPAEQEHIVRRKTRAYILGNIFCTNRMRNGTDSITGVVETAKLVDDFISQLSNTIEVFLVPGENEPTCTPILPQPPIHSMILPLSNHKANFRKLSNPANLKVSVTSAAPDKVGPPPSTPVSVPEGENIHLLLSSGKNVKDAMKSCDIKCPLQMGKKLLEWSHLNPTSQQVIPLVAGTSEDFFSLKQGLPHIFAIGNQNSFGVESWNGVKIVSIPDFDKTGTIALLNFELDVVPMSFKILL